MTETDILTFGQGILIMIQIALFVIFYFIYEYFFREEKFNVTNFLIIIIFFSLWVFSVTIFENITLALNVPTTKTANIPYGEVKL